MVAAIVCLTVLAAAVGATVAGPGLAVLVGIVGLVSAVVVQHDQDEREQAETDRRERLMSSARAAERSRARWPAER